MLDLALRARPIRPAALDLEAVMAGEVKKARVDALGIDDHLAHVVIEHPARPAPKESERVLMAANQSCQRH